MAANPGRVAVISDGAYHQALSITLPTGRYSLVAKVSLKGGPHGLGGGCDLLNGSEVLDRANPLDEGDFSTHVFPLVGLVTLPTDGTIRIACRTGRDGIEVFDSKLLATTVSAL